MIAKCGVSFWCWHGIWDVNLQWFIERVLDWGRSLSGQTAMSHCQDQQLRKDEWAITLLQQPAFWSSCPQDNDNSRAKQGQGRWFVPADAHFFVVGGGVPLQCWKSCNPQTWMDRVYLKSKTSLHIHTLIGAKPLFQYPHWYDILSFSLPHRLL